MQEVVAPEPEAGEHDEEGQGGDEDARSQAQQSRRDGDGERHGRPDQGLRQEDRPPEAHDQLGQRGREGEDEHEGDPSAIVPPAPQPEGGQRDDHDGLQGIRRGSGDAGVDGVGATQHAAHGRARNPGVRPSVGDLVQVGRKPAGPQAQHRDLGQQPVAHETLRPASACPPPAQHQHVRPDRQEHGGVVCKERRRRSEHVGEQGPPGRPQAPRSFRVPKEEADPQHGRRRSEGHERVPPRLLRVPDLERGDREQERGDDPEAMVADRPTERVHERDREHAERHRGDPARTLAVAEPQPAVEDRIVERRVPGIDDRAPTPELSEGQPREPKARGFIQPQGLRSDAIKAEDRPERHYQQDRNPRGRPRGSGGPAGASVASQRLRRNEAPTRVRVVVVEPPPPGPAGFAASTIGFPSAC